MYDFRGALYHSDFHADAEQFRGKRVVIVGAGSASGDIRQYFVTIVQRSATCVLPFSNKNPIEELDFRTNPPPLAFLLRLAKSGGTPRMTMLDKELHEGLRKAGLNLTWEPSPGSGEVGFAGFLFSRSASGTRFLIVKGKVKRMADSCFLVYISPVLCSTGNEPVMKATRALLGDKITDQLPPDAWGLDSKGEVNQMYRPSGHPGLWFAIGSFGISRFFNKHALQILARELGIA
ncbi:uncharacterized protein EDB91DRAFT_1153687 [Suillus paluster]|uniref:uncharacterized protein n=1 Tax=Suillus paluster TaxID=48578 RepID=UPI001B86538D|nr:uncharacterized protein EDB91DRAFT_1153687 [Suillus paluster]KAG1731622.1 hypothetical protein EDB91DRAFT_1153687 [Suillus paluster]